MLPVAIRDQFLENLAETGNIAESARRLGVSRMATYQWKWTDPDFSRKWDVAVMASREQLRERVVDTAILMGLARMVPKRDASGNVVFDDDLEPVMVPDVSHVDARVLMKFMDKTMQDEVRRVDSRNYVQGHHVHQNLGDCEVVLVGPDGVTIEDNDTIEGEWSEAS